MDKWFSVKGLKCVVLCAGAGRRIQSEVAGRPKVMREVRGRPILEHVVAYWRRFTNDFVFVVGYGKEQVIDHARKLPVNAGFVEQTELKGIADAIRRVEGHVAERFIVVLGDCICHGDFRFLPGMEQGVGVHPVENREAIMRSYSLDVKDNLVLRVEEKPKEVRNNLCGMGFYFFDSRVFRYIEKTPASALRGEVEITDALQNMISSGEKISPVFFDGDYLNVTFPGDLEKAEALMLKWSSLQG